MLKRLARPCLLLLVGLSPCAAQEGMPPATVWVAPAELRALAPTTLVPGTVVSRSDARLAGEVEGRLLEVAEVGTVVSKGDVVAVIEDTRLLLRREELSAEVSRVEARLAHLEGEERRYATLAESNLASTNQLELTRADRGVSEAELRVAKSRLAQTEDELARTRIRAPFNGVVVERLQMPGERQTEGEDVLRLVDQQNLEIVARAPLDFYAFVKQGQALEVHETGREFQAIVRTAVALGSENKHQFELRLDPQVPDLPVGLTLRVAVPMADLREVLAVNRDALVLRPEGTFVYVIEADGTARQVDVVPGIGAGELIEVSGDLNAGDQVVIRGNERLQTGQAVAISAGG